MLGKESGKCQRLSDNISDLRTPKFQPSRAGALGVLFLTFGCVERSVTSEAFDLKMPRWSSTGTLKVQFLHVVGGKIDMEVIAIMASN